MRVCMLLGNPFSHDARVLREALALVEAGHEVTVIVRPLKDAASSEVVQGIRVVRAPVIRGFGVRTRIRTAAQELERIGDGGATDDKSRRLLRRWLSAALAATLRGTYGLVKIPFGLIRAALQTRAYVELCVAERPDVIHAHDLNTLRAGMIAKRRSGALLVYDSHELEAHRVRRNVFEGWQARWTERQWIRSVDRVITVSPSIGEVLARRYHLKLPTIILNVPIGQSSGARRDLRDEIGVSPDIPIVLYQGGIVPHRGLEQLGEAAGVVGHCLVVMMGPDHGFGAVLDDHFRQFGVSDRIRKLPPVPPDELLSWTVGADIGVCTTIDTSLNHRLSLPNKLFEYIAAGIPIVASDLPELRRVVAGEQIGELCDPTDPKSIAAAIRRILDDPEKATNYRTNAQRAAETYNWDVEKKKLVALYEDMDDLVTAKHT